MNRFKFAGLTAFTAAALLLLSRAPLRSQGPAEQHALDGLTAMKKANVALLEKQKATLAKLDELQELTNQLRIFSKRN